ncbi:uncharacterized protein LOC128227471 [Mya arenaria]|uniref:uncharacterized protein LOC128227471 n=1 Tax=Mya arenaria TaxID=6604 RepID=UPI0022E71473|nr:uncharacterized protein LOC128227471 [Mya arenaria]
MPFCGLASTWAKVAAVMVVASMGLHASGYGTNYWMARYTVRDKLNFGIGLWKMTNCSGGHNYPCSDSDFPSTYNNTKVTVVRVFESLVLIMILVCMVCLIFYVGSIRSRTRGMAIAVMSMLFLAATFGVNGMAVWVTQVPQYHYPSWSFGLTVFAITVNITAAILLIPDVREYDYKDLLKVGGHYDNLEVSREDSHHAASGKPKPGSAGGVARSADFRDDMKPVIESQGPKAAPTYQYLHYDKRRKMDGF